MRKTLLSTSTTTRVTEVAAVNSILVEEQSLTAFSIIGQVFEAFGIQLLGSTSNIKTFYGRLISIFWGVLLLGLGFWFVLESLDGDYNEIDKVIVLPLLGSLIILGALGTILKTSGRLLFMWRAHIRTNWQCDWFKRCVVLASPVNDPTAGPEFSHYSALVELFTVPLDVCEPSVNRGFILSLLLMPIYLLSLVFQKFFKILEDLIYFIFTAIFTREFQWKKQNLKLPFVTDKQLDVFEENHEKIALQEHGSKLQWALSCLQDRTTCEENRSAWAQCIASLHVANILTVPSFATLIKRSLFMETPASLFGRIESTSLRKVAGSWYANQTEFLTILKTDLNTKQGEEPGIQLVWNTVICNEQIPRPLRWAEKVLESVEKVDEYRVKPTQANTLKNRELNHVATSQEKWFLDVAMYCWWNMNRCIGTDQMVGELANYKFTNFASVLISTTETILQRDYSLINPLQGNIGVQPRLWLCSAARTMKYKSEPQPSLPPSVMYYGARSLTEALELTQQGLSQARQEAYSVVAASLWSTAVGYYLSKKQCDEIAKYYNDPQEVLNLSKEFAKAYWNSRS